MTKPERRRLKRLERRCDWLEARIAIAESKGVKLSFDVAELSALRWALDRIRTTPDQLWDRYRALEPRIARQRRVIRNLIAYQHRTALQDAELDALIDAADMDDPPTGTINLLRRRTQPELKVDCIQMNQQE